MTTTQLSGWITVILLCICALSFSGCSGEQGAAYKKAETALYHHKYKEAALLFESAGEYSDAAEKSRTCWREYADAQRYFANSSLAESTSWQMLDKDHLYKMLVPLQEAKSVFEHIDDKKRAARNEVDIKTVESWIAVQAEQNNGNDENAIALLEAMDSKDKKVRDTIAFIRTKDERQRRLALLQAYLDRAPQPKFAIDEKQSFHANMDRLLMLDTYRKDHDKVAAALAATRCYDSIAQAWNKEVLSARKHKLSFEGGSLQTRVTKHELFLALLQLAEDGDNSPEFIEILALLRAAVLSPDAKRYNPDLLRYAKLIELYNGGVEWVDKCFPLADLQYCKTPGTVDYRVVHAPQYFRDALYDETTDVLPDRFTRAYSAQEAKELFADFVPDTPLRTGFIVIIDKGTPPPSRSSNTTGGQILNYMSYESVPKSVTVSYEREAGTPPLIEERIQQKGEYFCVANPNNARLAIYETYSFKHYGKYQVSGRPDMVDVYLPTVDIRVVDLVTQKTLVTDTISLNAEQSYRVPANIQQGEAYVPLLSFDKQRYLTEKLGGSLK